jgi:hypothetical protein
MEIAVGLLSLWAGSWKSVSVCGVNAGFVSRIDGVAPVAIGTVIFALQRST